MEHQFLALLGLIGAEKLGALDVQAFGQRHRAAEVHRALDGRDRPLVRKPKYSASSIARVTTSSRRHDLVDGPVGQRLRGRERLALEDRDQRLVGADQPGQPLGATTARNDAQEDFGLADEEVAVGHDPQIACPGELRAQAESRTVEGGNEDDTAGVHPQKRRVQAVELDGSPQRSPAHHRLQDTGAVYASGHAHDGRGPRRLKPGPRPLFLQPPHVGMADEPVRARPGEHDGVNVWIAVGAVHQIVELVGDLDAEQAVRPAVDPDDQDGPAVLDLKVAVVVMRHQGCFPLRLRQEGSRRLSSPSMTQ